MPGPVRWCRSSELAVPASRSPRNACPNPRDVAGQRSGDRSVAGRRPCWPGGSGCSATLLRSLRCAFRGPRAAAGPVGRSGHDHQRSVTPTMPARWHRDNAWGAAPYRLIAPSRPAGWHCQEPLILGLAAAVSPAAGGCPFVFSCGCSGLRRSCAVIIAAAHDLSLELVG